MGLKPEGDHASGTGSLDASKKTHTVGVAKSQMHIFELPLHDTGGYWKRSILQTQEVFII